MAFVVRGHCLRQAQQQRQGNKNNASKQQHENLNNNSSNKNNNEMKLLQCCGGVEVGAWAGKRKRAKVGFILTLNMLKLHSPLLLFFFFAASVCVC